MIGGEVERFEVVPIGLDLGAGIERVAHLAEDRLHLAADDRDRVEMAEAGDAGVPPAVPVAPAGETPAFPDYALACFAGRFADVSLSSAVRSCCLFSAAFAASAKAVKAAASRTAMSARTFRSTSEPEALRPAMSCE